MFTVLNAVSNLRVASMPCIHCSPFVFLPDARLQLNTGRHLRCIRFVVHPL